MSMVAPASWQYMLMGCTFSTSAQKGDVTGPLAPVTTVVLTSTSASGCA